MDLLIPSTGLLFWMSLTFLVVLFILWKFGFPAIVKMVTERKAFIDDSLRQAHDVPVEQIRECQNQFLDAMRSSHNDILDTLADGQLSDEVIKVIEDTMANVVGQYKG